MARSTTAFGAAFLALTACGRLGFDATAQPDADPGTDAHADAPIDGSVAACPQLFCDGFAIDLGGWDGTSTQAGSTVAHTPMGFAGGALDAKAPDGSPLAAVYKDLFAPLPTNLYVRAYVYAPSGKLLDLEPVELADPAGDHQIVFALYDSGIDIHAHSMARDFMTASALPTPRDRWVCFELHVEIAAAGRVELFLDGALLLAESNALDTRPPGGSLARLLVGIPSKPPAGPAEVLVDEVVADTQRIGCL